MFVLAVILINALVYFYINVNHPDLLYVWGFSQETMYNPLVWVTSVFMHVNLMHIGMNMAVLFQIGFGAEKNLGIGKISIVYILSAIGGSAATLLFIEMSQANVLVVGASGAIFGLYAFLSMYAMRLKAFAIEVVIFHVIVIAFGLPVAWYAHAGGILVGLALVKTSLGRKMWLA